MSLEIYIYIYISNSSNHKCCIEGGLINFNYKRNLAFRIILAFFPSLVANVLRHNHLVEPGVEGRKVTSQCMGHFFIARYLGLIDGCKMRWQFFGTSHGKGKFSMNTNPICLHYIINYFLFDLILNLYTSTLMI